MLRLVKQIKNFVFLPLVSLLYVFNTFINIILYLLILFIDGSFIAIIEHTKHAFLYEKPENNLQIGKQKILDFGSEISPILGAAFINKYLIILTKDVLYQLQIYS
jgi:hypothetical protein